MAPAPGIAMCQSVVVIFNHEQKGPPTMNITTIGLDLAKNVFQVHAIDEAGEVVVGKALHRRQMMPFFSKLDPCLVGMEVCATTGCASVIARSNKVIAPKRIFLLQCLQPRWIGNFQYDSEH